MVLIMKVILEVININDIIEHWVKDYEFKEGESLVRREFYFDPTKGKVVFRLLINETEVNQEQTK